MVTLRHQIASLQPKKFALCFFPIDNSLEPCKTSLINEGAVRDGNMVQLYRDKKNPDLLTAKIIFLEGKIILYYISMLLCSDMHCEFTYHPSCFFVLLH